MTESAIDSFLRTEKAPAAPYRTLSRRHFNGAMYGGLGMFKYEYDFTKDGGAISVITLNRNNNPMPKNFIIVAGGLDVITVPTGAAGNGALHAVGANDIITAAAISGAPWASVADKEIIPVLSDASKWIKTTAVFTFPKLTIITGAFTAGKFNLFLLGFPSD